MHNMHIVVVRARNGGEACAKALEQIDGWGSESNWSVACGAWCENGDLYDTGEGRWGRDDGETLGDLVGAIRNTIDESVSLDGWSGMGFAEVAAQYAAEGEISDDLTLWYRAKKFCDAVYTYLSEAPRHREFDVFTDSFCRWQLDEFGVTNLVPYESSDRDGVKWAVAIDMHR